MKTKALTYAIITIAVLVIGSFVYYEIRINSLKNKVSKVFDQQIDSLKLQIKDLQLSKDSLSNRVDSHHRAIDSLENYSTELIKKRNTNNRYYEQKINSVNTVSNDSIRFFLSNYKYSQ